MLPALQLVCAADGIEDLLAWLEAEMVGVVQTQSAARLLELFGSNALQGGLGSDGHEHGEVNGAMGQGENRSAGSCSLSLVKAQMSAENHGGEQGKRGLTEHLATSSKVKAPCVADRAVVDAMLLAIHMLLPWVASTRCVADWREGLHV